MLRIHDLYGQSFAHEFQFANPDSIKNAVKRYNVQRAAERDECKKDKAAHKPSKPRFCKMRNSANDVLSMVISRDLDVETQMSLQVDNLSDQRQTSVSSETSSKSSGKSSGCDQDNTIQIVERLAGGADTCAAAGGSKQKRAPDSYNYGTHIEGLHREVCAELQFMSQSPSGLKVGAGSRRSQQRHSKKKQQHLKPKKAAPSTEQHQKPETAHSHRTGKQDDKILERLKQVMSVDKQSGMSQVAYEDYPQPLGQWADVIPSPMMPQAMRVNVCEALNTTPSAACLFMEQHGTVEPEPLEPFFVEDSDLEQEYIDRPGYMRYIERLPYKLSDPDIGDAASAKKPCFIELEAHPHWISLQRSLKPMHFTSQRSETDTCTPCEPQAEKPTKAPQATPAGKATGHKAARRNKPKSSPVAPQIHAQTPRVRQPKRKLTAQQPATTARQHGGRDKEQHVVAGMPPVPLPPATMSLTPPVLPQVNTPRRRKTRPMIVTRSLENLKFEKMAIYNKIALTQERIITALDRLQSSLLQLQMPNCSSQEKQRRERNAFEFCVRFSRNFLYPLRGMIEDVRCTPVTSFNSATSNEASQRVVGVYALIHHSIGRYQRQLRYFLLDKVPQKLSALIEMMYTLTNVCLEKGVFDRNDPVAECLQQRCTRFLTFIEDMQEQRFQLARETYRRLKKRATGHGHGYGHVYGHGYGHGHGQPHGQGPSRQAMHERYDLKMFLNDLKLYEPRLVPRDRLDKRRRLRKSKALAGTSNATGQPGGMVEQPTEMQLDQPVEEVPTHIECVQCGDNRGEPSSETNDINETNNDSGPSQKQQLSNILALLQKPGREKHELHKQLLEAMQHVTKSQVHKVLDPLIRSLGEMLSKKMKPNGE